MAKSKTVFCCQQCGFESPKWNGKCPSCGAWNSLVEETIQPAATKTPSSRKKADLSNFIQELQAVDTQEDIRYRTGIGELDRVLGGGLVKGSIVLLGGEPGIGKSTLLLQICEFFGASHSILYVSGEESTNCGQNACTSQQKACTCLQTMTHRVFVIRLQRASRIL